VRAAFSFAQIWFQDRKFAIKHWLVCSIKHNAKHGLRTWRRRPCLPQAHKLYHFKGMVSIRCPAAELLKGERHAESPFFGAREWTAYELRIGGELA